MPATLAQPAITQTSVTPTRWRLDQDLVVSSRGWTLVVPAGFLTDLASIPRFVWWLIAPFELSIAAPIVHDYLYTFGGKIRATTDGNITAPGGYMTFTRSQADAFLYDLAAADGVWWWRRWLAYKAVRWFGARYWSAA